MLFGDRSRDCLLFENAAYFSVGGHDDGQRRNQHAEQKRSADEPDFRHDFRGAEPILTQFEKLGEDDILAVHEDGKGCGERESHQQEVFTEETPHQQHGVDAEALHEGVNVFVLAVLHTGQR